MTSCPMQTIEFYVPSWYTTEVKLTLWHAVETNLWRITRTFENRDYSFLPADNPESGVWIAPITAWGAEYCARGRSWRTLREHCVRLVNTDFSPYDETLVECLTAAHKALTAR